MPTARWRTGTDAGAGPARDPERCADPQPRGGGPSPPCAIGTAIYTIVLYIDDRIDRVSSAQAPGSRLPEALHDIADHDLRVADADPGERGLHEEWLLMSLESVRESR